MLTRTLASEVAPKGVRGNAIAPGYIVTPFVAPRFTKEDGTIDEEKKAQILAERAAGTPLRITGSPRDIALAALYLASDASSFMTGQIIRSNGGVSMPG